MNDYKANLLRTAFQSSPHNSKINHILHSVLPHKVCKQCLNAI